MSSDVPAGWEAEAEAFLRDFASETGATIERKRLTERLIAFELHPEAADGTRVSVVVSEWEVLVQAGGTRLELDPLPASRTKLEEVLTAIMKGRLNKPARWFGGR